MGYDITVVKDLHGYEDVKTTMIFAKADSRLRRDAMRSVELLEKNDYRMVAESGNQGENLLSEKASGGCKRWKCK